MKDSVTILRAVRHGEVLLVPVDECSKAVDTKHVKSSVVGHSETGHHHVLESSQTFDVMTTKDKKELYVRLFKPGKMVHQKTVNRHNDLNVMQGLYQVIQKQEYDPFLNVMRQVWD